MFLLDLHHLSTKVLPMQALQSTHNVWHNGEGQISFHGGNEAENSPENRRNLWDEGRNSSV